MAYSNVIFYHFRFQFKCAFSTSFEFENIMDRALPEFNTILHKRWIRQN